MLQNLRQSVYVNGQTRRTKLNHIWVFLEQLVQHSKPTRQFGKNEYCMNFYIRGSQLVYDYFVTEFMWENRFARVGSLLLFQLCLFNEATVPGYETISGTLPQCVWCLAGTCTVLPVWSGGCHRQHSVTLQSLTATLIPLFPAQSTLGTDILVYWIGKIVRTYAAGGSQTLDFLRERRTPTLSTRPSA